MQGTSVLIEESPEGSLTLSVMWGQCEKMAVYEPGSRLSPNTVFSSALILDFPSSRTMINVCWLSYPIYGSFVKAAPMDKTRREHHYSLLMITPRKPEFSVNSHLPMEKGSALVFFETRKLVLS